MTTPWQDLQLQTIDEQIAKAKETTTDQGTVQSVQSDAFRAMVVFDGTSVAMPVKVAAHVGCIAPDRVVLQKFGSDWVIMGNVSALRWPGCGGYNAAASAGTTSTSFANMPGTPSFTLVKRWDATRVRWTGHISCYCNTLAGTATIGITYNAGSTTITIATHTFANTGGDPALDRITFGGIAYQSGLAAGTYTVRARWKADATTTNDTDDWVTFSGEEVAP